MLKSAPVALDNLMLTHSNNSLNPPATIAAIPNDIVRGKINSSPDLIFSKLIKSWSQGDVRTFSGWVKIPIKGSTAPRLTTSATEVTSVSNNSNKNCTFLFLCMCIQSLLNSCIKE